MTAFFSEALARRLLADELCAVSVVEETGSTNDDLKEMARLQAPRVPVLLVAQEQSAPRGTKGRAWIPPEAGLYFSVALPLPRLCGLSAVAVGLAVTDASRSFGLDVGLKWPNDIWVAGGKAGGILCEAVQDDAGRWTLVAGIGCNLSIGAKHAVMQTTSGWPIQDFRSAGGALLQTDEAARTAFVAACTRHIVERVRSLSNERANAVIREDWAKADAFFGQVVHWCDGIHSDIRIGIDRGIDDEGRLMMEPIGPDASNRRKDWLCLSGELCSLRR